MASVETTTASGVPAVTPRRSSRAHARVAPTPARSLRDSRGRRAQAQLARAGVLLLPLGILVIAVGWSATAGRPLGEQSVTVVWAGFGGLALTCLGACLYVGSLLYRLALESRTATEHLAETALALADAIARNSGRVEGGLDLDGLRVTAGGGSTVHRRDCPLIAERTDLGIVVRDDPTQVTCRVCRP